MNVQTGDETPLNEEIQIGGTYKIETINSENASLKTLMLAPITIRRVYYEDDLRLFQIDGDMTEYHFNLLNWVEDYYRLDSMPVFEVGHRYELIDDLKSSFIYSRNITGDEDEYIKNMHRAHTQKAVLEFLGEEPFVVTALVAGNVAEIFGKPNETPQDNSLVYVLESDERRYFRDLGHVETPEDPAQDTDTGLEARLRALFELPDSSFVIRCEHTGRNDRLKTFDEFTEWLNVHLALGLANMDNAKARYKENLDEVTRIGDTVRSVLGK